MAAAKRIADEPAYVLHSYDWSESSLILEVFCRRQGRVALVAKGAKKPSSNFRPVLLPLQPVALTYTLAGDGDADIHTLKGAEWLGGHVMPTGDALLSGLYLNELLLRLLARADPHTALFEAYAGVVRVLAGEPGAATAPELLEPVLRSFELLLLREIGLLPGLDVQTLTLTPLVPDQRYTLVPEGGLRAASAADRASLAGSQWQALQRALDDAASYTATLRACAPVAAELKPQLRAVLQYHCGSPVLRTRQLMIDLQSL
ncbi:DNA repair protein RecO [Paracidovorax sp. MALMAid1276]|uniref:DNA repair protein RecO n=1 Tax=Paracidovorax sp. MALMAid1276 TaxID=3411631 RepID=UPI003B9C4E2C